MRGCAQQRSGARHVARSTLSRRWGGGPGGGPLARAPPGRGLRRRTGRARGAPLRERGQGKRARKRRCQQRTHGGVSCGAGRPHARTSKSKKRPLRQLSRAHEVRYIWPRRTGRGGELCRAAAAAARWRGAAGVRRGNEAGAPHMDARGLHLGCADGLRGRRARTRERRSLEAATQRVRASARGCVCVRCRASPPRAWRRHHSRLVTTCSASPDASAVSHTRSVESMRFACASGATRGAARRRGNVVGARDDRAVTAHQALVQADDVVEAAAAGKEAGRLIRVHARVRTLAVRAPSRSLYSSSAPARPARARARRVASRRAACQQKGAPRRVCAKRRARPPSRRAPGEGGAA